MPLAKSQPIRFTPRGLADAWDSSDVFSGACRKLINLVFDQSNPDIVIARPGVDGALTSLAGLSSPGFISIQITLGNYIIGMVATSRTVGFDEPFVYNFVTNTLVTVTGLSAANTEGRPASPSTSGDWVPPTMAVIGTKLIITHPGYTGAGTNFFGVLDISNLATPSYSTTNLATNPLPAVPTGVANLNNRAYYIVGNKVYYSDVLVPTTASTATQSLTLGDNTNITVLSGLPVQTTTAGVVSALLAFKTTQIWQITGDAAVAGSLALNYLSLNIGTNAPRSVVPSPLGTFFSGPDSAYLVTPFGAVTPVTNAIGSAGVPPDLRQPFGNIQTPTRAAAAFAGNIYRISLTSSIDGVVGRYDYWFDTRRLRWNGPHTFAYDCASSAGSSFVLSGVGTTSKLFNSAVFPSLNTLYTDNAAPISFQLESCALPRDENMDEKMVIESTIELSTAGAAVSYQITAINALGTTLNLATIVVPSTGSIWGSFTWGVGKWSSSINRPSVYTIAWGNPLVFQKLSIQVAGSSQSNISIGTFFARYQYTGYTNMGS